MWDACPRHFKSGESAGGGNRTLTGSEPHGILSPARLPVSPLRHDGGLNQQLYTVIYGGRGATMRRARSPGGIEMSSCGSAQFSESVVSRTHARSLFSGIARTQSLGSDP